MDPGHYIIVASTQRPNQPGEFFLRVYAKKGNTLGYAVHSKEEEVHWNDISYSFSIKGFKEKSNE